MDLYRARKVAPKSSLVWLLYMSSRVKSTKYNGLSILSKAQFYLYRLVQQLFPEQQVIPNHRHPQLKLSSGASIQLDIFIHSLSLAFEYQGVQHYSTSLMFGSHAVRQKRDQEKQAVSVYTSGLLTIQDMRECRYVIP